MPDDLDNPACLINDEGRTYKGLSTLVLRPTTQDDGGFQLKQGTSCAAEQAL